MNPEGVRFTVSVSHAKHLANETRKNKNDWRLCSMFHNIKRDYDKTLKEQIKEGTSKGWIYIGVFGRGANAILKFAESK